MSRPILPALLAAALLGGCNAVDSETQAILDVKTLVAADLDVLHGAAVDLQTAAPAADADGWSADTDGAAVDAMRASWRDARVSYERVEGAIAVLFPQLDASTDERYDGFIAEEEDSYLFDGEGVTGVHALERILWADEIPSWVVEFESSLSGYVPAAFPATEGEASDFKASLAQRLVDDVEEMRTSFEPLALDGAAAYGGVVGSVAEQAEKINLASTGEDESRYAQHTLADMRANLAGGEAIYEAFSGWIVEEGGEDADAAVRAGFDRVSAAYDAVSGDAIPAVPETWNPDDPSEADLATEYGQLWSLLQKESDPDDPESLVSLMVDAGAVVGIEVIP